MNKRQGFWFFGEGLMQQFATRSRFKPLNRAISLFLVGIGLSVAIAACGGSPSTNTTGSASSTADSKKGVEINLVAYAVPKAAHDAIITLFQEKWQKEKGQTVTFTQSYGGSGSQTRAIIDGLEADVVHLALGADVEKLVEAKIVNEDWNKKLPNSGIVAKSVAAVITREGNPKNIKTFGDLTRDGVKWITANPKTSGGARWNFLVMWDYALKNGGDETKATEFATQAFKNVAILAKDAREATDVFAKQGQGDALINYENEVILAKQNGQKIDYVVPEINISIDTPAAVVDKNVDKHGTREVAEAFTKFLFSPEAQAEFVKLGFRPVGDYAKTNEKTLATQFPAVKKLATVDEYGGWSKVQEKFFADGALFDQIQSKLGKS
ncbi:sulfate ABC transporter substrate-binding protein [Phormidium sp. CLA17]|uniref:sulfate ABC transporter substrate-binding protein n=1 Tax=Leptolyngbya sp. Cla-17 TaxID=2803751 RepID=UPI001492A13C|nr:sulfate ABC transporter substrate-binding protein [Leptolyngbya sp. Cla-17]MBM0741672.1 sulfate ABC transporter substrate-binding protein [Leptolyngbya sp. Cla-17]